MAARTNPRRVTQGMVAQMYANAETQLVSIYADLERCRRPHNNSPNMAANPFYNCDRWEHAQRQRYQEADSIDNLGRECLVIAMHSATFSTAICNASNDYWPILLTKVKEYRYSLRMFAIMRYIPYSDNYNTCLASVIRYAFIHSLGHQPLPANLYAVGEPHQAPLLANHEHEVYLTSTDNVDRLINKKVIKLPMRRNREVLVSATNITESIYNASTFDGYSHDWAGWPSDPRDVIDPTERCWHCNRHMVPRAFGSQVAARVANVCNCTRDIFTRPLVEIKQYPNLVGDQLSVNRGVRSLVPIRRNDLLEEYVGDILPTASQDEFGDQDYAFTIHGQPLGMVNGKMEWGDVSLVSAVKNGNWTRYMNHVRGGKNNIRFRTVSIANKTRIILIAKWDIPPGMELTVSYGTRYWTKEK